MNMVRIKSGDKFISATIHQGVGNKLAVLVPGYLDSKDYEDLATLAEELNSMGFTIARFNPIGVWDSDGTIEDYCVSEYLKNIRSIIDYMEEENQRRFECILVGGKSLGGFVSTIYASCDHRVSLVFSITAPTTLVRTRGTQWEQEGIRTSLRDLPENPDHKVEYRVPWSFALDGEQYVLSEALEHIKIPILFVAGERDEKISLSAVARIYNQASGPKQLSVAAGVQHDYRFYSNQIRKVNDVVVSFVRKFQ